MWVQRVISSHKEAIMKVEAAKTLAEDQANEERESKERMLAALASRELYAPDPESTTPGVPSGIAKHPYPICSSTCC